MRILFYEWGSYTAKDIESFFSKNGIQYKLYTYVLKDKNHDEKFISEFSRCISEGNYDAVFSVNYFPLVAECCYKKNIKYISWSYDNPLNVIDIEKTLGYATNYVFMFDKVQCENYRNKGFDNIYHLPLAVNVDRLSKIMNDASDISRYQADISFVGNLYSSMLGAYVEPLSEYQKGYIDGICNVQSNLYGYYCIDSMLTDSFMNSINEQYKIVKPDTTFVLPREALSYAMAAEVTRKERLSILGILSNHFDVQLYSREKIKEFANIKCKGECDYYSEMPKIFKNSKVNMNITLKILQSGIPLRVLDIMGTGGFVLSNYQPELAENFVNEQEVVMYDSIEDAFCKAEYYLRHDEEREEIAKAGYQKVKQEYTYEKQFSKIMTIVFGK